MQAAIIIALCAFASVVTGASLPKYDNGEVVFLGDSITDFWDNDGLGKPVWEQYYVPLGAKNVGVSGDVTQQTIDRIIGGNIDGINPRLAVLKIGTNDLARGYEVDYVVDQIGKILSILRAYIPNAKIILLGVLPRNDANLHQKIREVNNKIRSYDDGNTIRFLNMENSFTDGTLGTVKPGLFTDGLHLTTQGYQVWHDTMAPLFDQLFYGKQTTKLNTVSIRSILKRASHYFSARK